MMLSDLLTSLGSAPLPLVLGTAVGTTVAAMGALVGVSSWIDRAPEGPDGPLGHTDYREAEQLPILCSYADSGCTEPSMAQVAGWELCERHADEILARA